jgi:hypothetical protein
MKTLTLAAMVATLVAIPLILRKRRTRLGATRIESDECPAGDSRLYDVFDFVT